MIKQIERDENGLIKGLDYKFTEDGLIDWRALVPAKFLYLKNDIKSRPKLEKKYGKNYSEIDIVKDNVIDTDLVISLAGIKYLLRLRGCVSINEMIKESNQEYASVTSNITYIPNFETEMRVTPWSASACATLQNTTDFYQRYLVEAASNRAFARNVRTFLNINIVSKEELGKDNEEENGNSSSVIDPQISILIEKLESKMSARNITFEQLKNKLIKEKVENAESFQSLKDIPKDILFNLVERIEKAPKK